MVGTQDHCMGSSRCPLLLHPKILLHSLGKLLRLGRLRPLYPLRSNPAHRRRALLGRNVLGKIRGN